MDGLFQKIEGDTAQNRADPRPSLRFHEATALTHELLEGLQQTVRKRVLRHMVRQGLLEPHDAQDMLGWEHGGGFSLNASVRIEATDREGLERLTRYCARPPFALERLHLVADRSDQILHILPKPDPAGRTALRLSTLEFASPYYPPLSTPSASSASLRFSTAWPRPSPHPASTATVTTVSSPPTLP